MSVDMIVVDVVVVDDMLTVAGLVKALLAMPQDAQVRRQMTAELGGQKSKWSAWKPEPS